MKLNMGATLSLDKEGASDVPWLFLPGGPGMGSESLLDLTQSLELDAPIYRVDLPDDGGNQLGLPISLRRWQLAVLEVTEQFEKVVWVGHSFGGMLLQTIPQIAKRTCGLVLMNTAPDNQWYLTFADRAKSKGLPNTSLLKKQFLDDPTDEHYKSYMLNCLMYYFTKQAMKEGQILFESLPFNHKPYLWALNQFHPNYQSTWVPDMPCMILSSTEDSMTPEYLFNSNIYNKENIVKQSIAKAGHFPWVEQPESVANKFSYFSTKL